MKRILNLLPDELVGKLDALWEEYIGQFKAEEADGETLEFNFIPEATVDDAIKQGIVYLPEDRHTEGLCMRRAIYHNIHMSTFDKFVGKNGISESDMYDDALKWVDKFHIVTPNVENPVATLSGGNAQKVVISRLMSMNPKVLILNGPTVGVDVGAKFDIHEEIRRIAGEGVAVILISDDIAEVHANCNRIMVMRAGRITDEVRNCDVTEEELAEMLSRQE